MIGLALIAAALIWLFRWERLGARQRRGVLLGIVLASLGGVLMAVNFHIANGASHPWLIPKSGFDEGVDLDSLLPFIQLAIAAVAGRLWILDWRASSARPIEAPPDGHRLWRRPMKTSCATRVLHPPGSAVGTEHKLED